MNQSFAQKAAASEQDVQNLLEALQRLDALRQDERRAAVGRVASTLSHALGTPLNVIAGRAAMISMEGMSLEDIHNNARIVEQQVRSIASTLRQVLSFARDGKPDIETSDARAILTTAVQTLRPMAIARGVELALRSGDSTLSRLATAALLQTLTNLISLGIHREPSGGRIQVELVRGQAEPPPLERGRVSAGDYLCFTIRYDSTELPASLLGSVYEPWLGADCEDRDAALVLALSYGVARENRGWVEMHPESGSTRVVLHWPAVNPG